MQTAPTTSPTLTAVRGIVTAATRSAETHATYCHFGVGSWVKRAKGRINQWHGISDEVDAILSSDPGAVY